MLVGLQLIEVCGLPVKKDTKLQRDGQAGGWHGLGMDVPLQRRAPHTNVSSRHDASPIQSRIQDVS
jgi:hypothetical protein